MTGWPYSEAPTAEDLGVKTAAELVKGDRVKFGDLEVIVTSVKPTPSGDGRAVWFREDNGHRLNGGRFYLYEVTETFEVVAS